MAALNQRAACAVGVASFFALLSALAVFDVASVDFGWQLAAGRLIWSARAIPTHDVFSYIAAGNPWVDSHWLFQLGLYAVHEALGIRGVVALRLGLIAATFALLLANGFRREHWFAACSVCGLALLASYGRFAVRPELATFLFLAAFLLLLERLPTHPRAALVGIPLLQALWVNVHGLHVLGIVLVVAHLGGDRLQLLLARRRPALAAAAPAVPARRAALLVALAGLALLCNANGGAGIAYPFLLFGELRGADPLFQGIAELRPPLSAARRTRPDVVAWAILLGVAALAQAARWRRVRLAHLLPLLAFAYLSSLAIRNIALFAVVAAPITARNLCALLDDHAPPLARRRALSLAAAGLAALVAVGAGWAAGTGRLHAGLGMPQRAAGVGLSERFPEEVLPPLRALRGNFFNSPDLGGYLIWQLHPEKRVALDGRWEVYGDSLLPTLRAFREPARFARLAARHDVRAVVLGQSPMAHRMRSWIAESRHWRRTLHTPRAEIWERRSGGGPSRELARYAKGTPARARDAAVIPDASASDTLTPAR